MSPLGKGELSV